MVGPLRGGGETLNHLEKKIKHKKNLKKKLHVIFIACQYRSKEKDDENQNQKILYFKI